MRRSNRFQKDLIKPKDDINNSLGSKLKSALANPINKKSKKKPDKLNAPG
jgi:hypothetical protein